MADETTHTETSAATTDQATETTAEATAATETTATTEAASDEAAATAETTALGGAGETAETTEAAKEGETEGAEAKTAEVPETYELAVPEGFEKLDDQAVADATPVFKELGLTNEQANKLVPVAANFAKRIVEQRDQQLLGDVAAIRKDWLEAAKKDPEVGGANWDTSLAAAAKAFDALGFPKGSPLRNYLDESGAGNHVELIRFAAKVGKAIGEDGDFPRGDAGGKVAKTTAEKLYGPAFATGDKG